MTYKIAPLSAKRSRLSQRGAALIFIAFILGLGAAVYVLNTSNLDLLKAKQDAKTYQALEDAKVALISWAVSHKYTPGQMPWPDRKETSNPNYDGSSDCVATSFQPSYLLGQLPSLPTTSPCLDPNTGSVAYSGLSTYPSLGQEFRDAQGNRLWYAVSRNLVHDYEHAEDPIINPGMINAPHSVTPYLRQSGTQSYPWLQVFDRNGNLVSDRVAAVLIAPGEPIGGQDRSGVADPDQYLDGFSIGAANYKNSDYALVNEDFIIGEDSRKVSANDPTFLQPYNFNDKLVYITIDELMAALEKRVGEQTRASLKSYQDANGYYPYAAKLGTTVMYSGNQNLLSGFLPVNPQICNYIAPISISCTTTTNSKNLSTSSNFNAVLPNWSVSGSGIQLGTKISSITSTNTLVLSNAATASGVTNLTLSPPLTLSCTQPLFDPNTSAITQIRFYGTSAFSFFSGNCSINSSNRCYCTGIGSCSNAITTPSVAFSCDSSSCTAIGIGATGDIRVRGGKLTTTSGGCSITTPITQDASNCPVSTTNRMTCNSTNGTFASHINGDAPFDAFLPSWFNQNQWGRYVYYQLTRPVSSTITVGSKSSDATVITTGRPINSTPFSIKGSAQTQPSCNAINNYLDSTENTNSDTVFEATSKQRAGNYNDQTFLVKP